MNNDKWNSMPKDLQDIVQQCADESQAKQLKDRSASDAAAEKVMAEAGVAINEVTPEERAKMKDACQPIYDKYAKEYNLGALIDSMLALNN